MKVETYDQGTVEWMLGRLGRPTASRYDQILTPKTQKPAKTTYRAELLAEFLLGQPIEWGSSSWTERGTDMEAEARRWYEFHTDKEVEEVGFIARDDGKTGGSPDGLVEGGGLEIKCLGAINHTLHLLEDAPAYTGQVQGYMYLTDRPWWDILFYSPNLPKLVVRVDRDEEYLKAFIPVLDDFIGQLDEDKAKWESHRNLHPMSPEIQEMLR